MLVIYMQYFRSLSEDIVQISNQIPKNLKFYFLNIYNKNCCFFIKYFWGLSGDIVQCQNEHCVTSQAFEFKYWWEIESLKITHDKKKCRVFAKMNSTRKGTWYAAVLTLRIFLLLLLLNFPFFLLTRFEICPRDMEINIQGIWKSAQNLGEGRRKLLWKKKGFFSKIAWKSQAGKA